MPNSSGQSIVTAAVLGGFGDRDPSDAHSIFGGLVVFLVNLFGLGVILLWKFGREKPQTATE
jgi:hypothetical protein